LANSFSIEVEEVIIFNLVEGVFYAKLICNNGLRRRISTRERSDAIAIAVRIRMPYLYLRFILSTAGIVLEDNPD
jgi:bifunctional DNase/RNase